MQYLFLAVTSAAGGAKINCYGMVKRSRSCRFPHRKSYVIECRNHFTGKVIGVYANESRSVIFDVPFNYFKQAPELLKVACGFIWPLGIAGSNMAIQNPNFLNLAVYTAF
jgi:hypothetical protein